MAANKIIPTAPDSRREFVDFELDQESRKKVIDFFLVRIGFKKILGTEKFSANIWNDEIDKEFWLH